MNMRNTQAEVMDITFAEFDLMHSIATRLVNMTERFVPNCADFTQLTILIRELHSIHSLERKMVRPRAELLAEEKDVSDQAHCNPNRFFKYKSTLNEFKRFWRELNKTIYTKKVKDKLAAIYFSNPHITRIDVGYHIHLTGKQRGADLLQAFNASHTATRITFTDGTTLMIPSLEAADMALARAAYEEKVKPEMIPLPAYPKWR